MFGQNHKVKYLIFDLDNTLYEEVNFYLKFISFLTKKLQISKTNIVIQFKKNIKTKKQNQDPLKFILKYAKLYSVKNHDFTFKLLQNFKPIYHHIHIIIEILKKKKKKNCYQWGH